MADDARVNQLQLMITAVQPLPGTLMIIHPQPGLEFTPDFANWLGNTLEQMIPKGAKAMILSSSGISFEVIAPASDNEAYIQGWQDAVKAIKEADK